VTANVPGHGCSRAAAMIWVTHMKTTIDIADSLLERAKRLAARRRTTLRCVVEDALREALRIEQQRPPTTELVTRTFRGRGLQRGLSWDDWSAIRDLAYEGRGA
jgi:Arc/MetJ family transcription regulator